jgi:hypothetical protein
MRGAVTCIPDCHIISDALYCREGKINDSFVGYTMRNFQYGGNVPDNPGVNQQQDFFERIENHNGYRYRFQHLIVISGKRFSPSQIYRFGNSRKSSETTRRSIIIKSDKPQFFFLFLQTSPHLYCMRKITDESTEQYFYRRRL